MVLVAFFMNERIITAITEQKKDPNRVNIFLDNRFAFGISKKASKELKVGQQLTEEQVKMLLQRDESDKAFKKAAEILQRRPKTENELRKKLSAKGIAAEQIDEAVCRVKALNWVDDKKFSEMWIENQSVFRPRSKRMLAYELRRKGISEETISESLRDMKDDQAAFACAERYARRLRDIDPAVIRLKLRGYLVRRGFDYDAVRQAVNKVLDQRKSNAADSNLDYNEE